MLHFFNQKYSLAIREAYLLHFFNQKIFYQCYHQKYFINDMVMHTCYTFSIKIIFLENIELFGQIFTCFFCRCIEKRCLHLDISLTLLCINLSEKTFSNIHYLNWPIRSYYLNNYQSELTSTDNLCSHCFLISRMSSGSFPAAHRSMNIAKSLTARTWMLLLVIQIADY